ncbi:hypothetical protein A2U01_0022595 [Trifolium medium]|uniref:Uncharacterized protein n=1 Tax=Trifolium medium TaxID=97028 RepID=A0A392NNU6_9FABA|nr:hypothetical protein [Trifolium medium]
MAQKLSLSIPLILLFLFTFTLISAARVSLPPPPPDPFLSQPPEMSFPFTPITNETDLNPPPSIPDTSNHRPSRPWGIIGLAVGLGLGAIALAVLVVAMCCFWVFSPPADQQVAVRASAPPPDQGPPAMVRFNNIRSPQQ